VAGGGDLLRRDEIMLTWSRSEREREETRLLAILEELDEALDFIFFILFFYLFHFIFYLFIFNVYLERW